MKIKQGVVLLLLSLAVWGCVNDSKVVNNALIVRIQEEPERLNPILSRGSVAAQIEYLIFQPLAEIDPISLEFDPVILEKMPTRVLDLRADLGVVDRLDLRIKSDAQWSDGKAITYQDILFTLKMVFNQDVGAARFRSRLDFIKGEDHDEHDMKFITFYLDTAVFNSDKNLINFHILPAHVYDSAGLLKDISLASFINNKLTAEETARAKTFADDFLTEKFSRQVVTGSGAYEIESWNTGYELKLKKKANWWGDAHKKSNLFKAIPEEIIYKIIPDEQLAVTALANDNVDVIAGLNPEKFNVMREVSPDKYQYLTPKIPQYYYVILNNKSPLLADTKVRQALAYLVDQNKMIDVVMAGYGEPLTAPLMPGSKYYNESIKPYPFDVERASALLGEAGWEDSDEDGFLDKLIDGERQKLAPTIFITGGDLGRRIALLLQDNMKRAGVDIQIKSQKWSKSMEDMKSGNFEMAATANRQSLWEANLYPTWHSSSFSKGGDNFTGYDNPTMDIILESLDVEEDMTDRINLYHKFHKQIHIDVPVLFLLMPTERLLVSKDWHVDVSPRRPGYFENMFYRVPSAE